MKVKYKLTNAHVCQYGVCFKIPYVLIGNVTNRVILGMPFIFYIYLLFIENGSITTNTFKQKVKFKFISKFDIDTDDCLNTLIFMKTKHLNFPKQEIKFKKIAKQI